jgi:hypothetical protein
VDHVGLYIHASNESDYSTFAYGKKMIEIYLSLESNKEIIFQNNLTLDFYV